MVNLILTTLISVAITVGIYQYVPLSVWETLPTFQQQEKKLGSTIVTIAGTDTISGSRTTINDNFTSLNSGKIENSTTSVASITTLSNLVTVGTLTSGSLGSGFTAVVTARGGTGSTGGGGEISTGTTTPLSLTFRGKNFASSNKIFEYSGAVDIHYNNGTVKWMNTSAAITKVKFFDAGGGFLVNSVLKIYGGNN